MIHHIVDRLVGKCASGLLVGLVLFSQSLSFAAIVPANRVTTWQGNNGVQGGVPNSSSMTVFRTLPASATLADINSAIAACPSNQVVQLSAGTYNLTGQILFSGKSGVVLRGAGNSTVLNFSGGAEFGCILIKGPNFRSVVDNGPTYVANWTGGYAQGSTTLTLSSVANLAVGNILVVDQLNDDVDVTVNSWEGCGYCSRGSGTRAQQQSVEVKAISGNTVTVSPPIYMGNWRSSQAPQAWWLGNYSRRCGVENLRVNGQNSSPYPNGSNISIVNGWDCWVKDVRSENSMMCHINAYQSGRVEVRHCSFFGTQSAASQSYGVLLSYSSACLVEDNIFQKVTTPSMWGPGASGNIAGYNYFTNMYYTASASWMQIALSAHDGHTCMNIAEGNYANNIYADFYHGSSSHNTAFRNVLIGWEPDKSANTYPVSLVTHNRYYNFMGNILGKAGYHNTYELSGANTGGMGIYSLGYNHSYPAYDSGYDPQVVSTLYRHGNYDVVNNSVIWDSSNSDRALPSSMYLASKPAWFGNLAWPPYDPTRPSSAQVTNIPAGYRFVFGVDPPSGPVNLPPVAAASATPRSGSAPLTVAFSSAGSSDPEGASITYSWSFGDGTQNSTAANPSHTYSTDGAYVARLTVSDGVNTTTSINLNITVGNQPPVVAATATSATTGIAPLVVTFSSAGSLDPEGSTLTYSWTFGDGSTSTLANPSHTYAAVGNYVARLTVSDGVKTTASSDMLISVITPSTGLVAAYGFEDGSGSTLTDSSGNNNVGTLVNGPTWTTSGRFGKALSFNGTSSYVNIAASPSLNMTAGVTLMAWCYPTIVDGQYRNLIYKVEDICFLEGSTPNSVPRFSGTFASANLDATSALALNRWTHLAATYDGTTMNFYVNGVLNASRAQTGPILTSPDPLGIGGNALNGQFWAGLIDEVRIYNRALSSAQIVTDMNTAVVGGAAPAPAANLRKVAP